MFVQPSPGVIGDQWVRRIESMRREIRLPAARDAHEGWGIETCFFGKPDANIAKGATGLVSVYNPATETATGRKITCKALGAAVKAGKWVTLVRKKGIWFVAPWEK